MRPFRSFSLYSVTTVLLATSHLVLGQIDWKPYFEGYPANSLNNFRIPDVPRIAKPVPGLSKNRPVVDVNGNTIPDYNVLYEFDQLIDHNDASRGTFKMRYYHTWEYYRPGGPIILYMLGEQGIDVDNAELQMTNITITGALAQATNGAVVMLEHRYYGKSQPFSDLSVDSLRFHTISQALQDIVYFARNARLAMPGGDGEGIRPDRTPWIFVGGSYSGTLAAFLLEQHPGVFWASYSSSGGVQPKIDFWQYWGPIEQYMPANCTADVRAVVSLIDGVIDSGNQTRLTEIQTQFGLGSLRTIDFLSTLAVPFRTWQSLHPASSRNSLIYIFCNALETREGQIAPAGGWGVEIALPAYAGLFRSIVTSLCGGTTPEALQACDASVITGFNASTYMSTEVDNDPRSWMWTLCNESGWFQPGNPSGGGIVSKHWNVQAWATFCSEAFSGAFTNSTTEFQARVNVTTQQYKGWNTMADRVFVVNGRRDPWLGVTLSAPEANAPSTDLRPVHLTDGFHCSDMSYANSVVDQSLGEVWNLALTTFQRWVSEFGANRQGSAAFELKTSPLWLGVAVVTATLGMVFN